MIEVLPQAANIRLEVRFLVVDRDRDIEHASNGEAASLSIS